MTLSNRTTLALVRAAAAASLWLYLANINRSFPVASAQLPDLYVVEPHWELFDSNGELEKQLRARRLEKWAHEEATRLLEPRLELRDQRRRHWLASAEQGLAYPDQRPIHLENNVVLQRQQPESDLTVTTSRLLVARSGDRVETSAPVVLRTGNWHFNSIGLHADLGQQQVGLLGRVQGTYD